MKINLASVRDNLPLIAIIAVIIVGIISAIVLIFNRYKIVPIDYKEPVVKEQKVEVPIKNQPEVKKAEPVIEETKKEEPLEVYKVIREVKPVYNITINNNQKYNEYTKRHSIKDTQKDDIDMIDDLINHYEKNK